MSRVNDLLNMTLKVLTGPLILKSDRHKLEILPEVLNQRPKMAHLSEQLQKLNSAF